jgi:hypothetical protein
MNKLILSLTILVSASAFAEVKPRGTVLAQLCGFPTKTHTVCTARAEGTGRKYITVSTVRGTKQIPARVRPIAPGTVLWSGRLDGVEYELIVRLNTRGGGAFGTYKANGGVVGLAPFQLQVQFHTQGV